MPVHFYVLVLFLESQQVEQVIPLAFFLDLVDVVIDQVDKFFFIDFSVFPLVVDDCPDVLLLDLRRLEPLKPVIQILDVVELYIAVLFELAYLAPTLDVKFYQQGFLPLC